jgi:uncharacterized membrane protein YczE
MVLMTERAEAASRWRPSPGRAVRLLVGLWLFGVGEAMLITANLGNSPWTVLAQGVSSKVGLSVGLVTNILGVVVLLLWIPLRQRPGLGTLGNVALVGTSIDVTLAMLSQPDGLVARFALTVGGILVVAVGSGFYLGVGMGPGPRDGLMTGLSRVTRWPLGVTRAIVEVTVLVIGMLLGGVAGIGTLLFALGIGPCVNVAVRLVSRVPDDEL